jgi:hypothetical protein
VSNRRASEFALPGLFSTVRNAPPLRFRAFGLVIDSNVPLAPLLSCSTGRPDVMVRMGSSPSRWLETDWHRCDEAVPGDRVLYTASSEAAFRYVFSDGTEFTITAAGDEIWAAWPPPLTLDDASTYLLGPIMGAVLRLRGIISLHASVVAVGGYAFGFFGPAGAGKSTVAAVLATKGIPILADDMLVLVEREGRLLAQPTYPHVRLWPDAVAALFGSGDALPELAPPWEKRYLDLRNDGFRFQEEPLPLGGLFMLHDRSSGAENQQFTAVTGHAALIALVGNVYSARRFDARMRAEEARVLSHVVTEVPIQQTATPADFHLLPRFGDRLVEQAMRMVSTSRGD